MSSPALEGLLARLYTDESTLAEFLRRPAEIARGAGLSDAEVLALEGADHVGLVMAARSFPAKRQRRRKRHGLFWLFSGRKR
jgi:hypothetical protein